MTTKAERTVRDVTVSEAQVLVLGRAAARSRDPEVKTVLHALIEFWHGNEATEMVLPDGASHSQSVPRP